MTIPITYGVVPPDLSDLLFTHAKGILVIIWYRYKAKTFVPNISSMTPGQQVRLHLRRGGYRP